MLLLSKVGSLGWAVIKQCTPYTALLSNKYVELLMERTVDLRDHAK